MPGLNGLVIMKPTSISSVGGTSSIGADGKVTYSLCSSISLNGVFTSSYDNYLISSNTIGASDAVTLLYARWRAAGVDSASANTYVLQLLGFSDISLSGGRFTNQTNFEFGYCGINARVGQTLHIFGPALTQPTVNIVRSVNTNPANNFFMDVRDYAYTHNLNTSYDGFTLYSPITARLFSGNFYVYGFNQ